jgi:calcium-dependent protein kinase
MFVRKGSEGYGSLKIVDFGLSTKIDVEKYHYPRCGTPGYVAPEIL